MKVSALKTATRREFEKTLSNIYKSLKVTPVKKTRTKNKVVENDWNWHYSY